MIFGSDGEDDGPGLIIDGVRIPFHMEAQVSYGPPPEDPEDWSDWDEDAPWMIRLPVEVQVMIPDEILHPPMGSVPTSASSPARPMPGHVDPDLRPEPASWRPGDMIPLPHGFPDDDPPTSARALETLGLGEAMRATAAGRAGLPKVPGLIPDGDVPDGPAPADDDPADLAAMARLPGGGAGGTGHRALDAVFAAGPIKTLNRMMRVSAPVREDSGDKGTPSAIQPVSDRHTIPNTTPGRNSNQDRAHELPAVGICNYFSSRNVPYKNYC